MKKLLHVGCGQKTIKNTTKGFNDDSWIETRFDIDPKVRPDIIGSMTDMTNIGDSEFDALFSSHNIEHLFPTDVPIALGEFRRILKPKGFLVLTCPDLQSVCELVAEDKLTEPAYESPSGPIAPIDIIYGHRASIARGNHFMAHRCGFTEKVLQATTSEAGFSTTATLRRTAPHFDLWIVGFKAPVSKNEAEQISKSHFPI